MKKRIIAFFMAFTFVCALGAGAEVVDAKKVSGRAAIVVCLNSGKVVYKNNANKRLSNASTTKLITALYVIEKNKNLNKTFKISKHASCIEPTKLYMKAGDSYKIKDLLKALMMISANDCADALAEGTSGSVSAFMRDVNKYAKKLGMKNTHFSTPSGLPSSKPHYTTVSDMAILLDAVCKNETLISIMKTKSTTIKSVGGKKHRLKSYNALLFDKKYKCIGKTGFINRSKHCFAGIYQYKTQKYAIVVLGSPTSADRWKDAKTLIKIAKKHGKKKLKRQSANASGDAV